MIPEKSNSGYLGSHPVWEKVRKTHWKYSTSESTFWYWQKWASNMYITGHYSTLCKHLENAFALQWFMIKYLKDI